MSFFSAVGNNPEINQGQQLADRQALGVEDMYFINGSGDVTRPSEKLDQVDLEDRVVRRVDPNQLPLDKTDDLYRDANGYRYIPRTQTLPDGKTLQVWQRQDRRQPDDDKYVLIGGKFYQVEFEKDGKTYLTTQVKDLFENPGFTKGQSPQQRLALLQQIQKASGFLSWYQSGEYYRNKAAKGEDTSYLTEDKFQPRFLEMDEGVKKLEAELTGQCKGLPPPGTRSPAVGKVALPSLDTLHGVLFYLS